MAKKGEQIVLGVIKILKNEIQGKDLLPELRKSYLISILVKISN